MIQLNQFLEQLNKQAALKSVIVFTGSPDNFPLIVLTAKKIAQHLSCDFKKIECVESNEQELLSLINSSFLGNSLVYWITSLESSKQSTHLLSLLEQYQGPHQILLFLAREYVEKINNTNCTVVELPLSVDKKNYAAIAKTLYNLSPQEAYAPELFAKTDKISIEQCCAILNYIQVLGAQSADFLSSNWLEQIVSPDKSLFLLSQYLFAKEMKNFFAVWNSIKDTYNDMFWISFWAEQLWRAYFVTLFSKKQSFNAVKKISFRLPFSFIQKQYKDYSLNELKNAHNFVYDIDHGLKNGNSHISIEDFYGAFFSNTFKES